MADKKQVMSWLEGLTFDDWHMYHSDSEVQEIAKVTLELLKEQEAKQHISDAIHETAKQFRRQIVMCKDCKHATMTSDGKMCKYCAMDTDDFGDQRDVYHDAEWFCADGERMDG